MKNIRDSLENNSEIKKDKKEQLVNRIQQIYNTLIENEKKIWLKTNVGKGILQEFSISSEKTLDVILNSSINEFEPFIISLEACATKMREEERKRSMVVT